MAAITLSQHQIGIDITTAMFRAAAAVLASVKRQSSSAPSASPVIVRQQGDIPAVFDWLAEVSSTPDAVREFCERHKIMSSAVAAERMAEDLFPASSRVSLTVECDPESDAEWLAVDVVVHDRTANALACYEAFVKDWAKFPNAMSRQLIRLTYCHV